MATDNRTQLNNCDQDTDAWSGDSSTSDNTEAGNVYEGTASQGATLSNSLERILVSTIGGTRDLTDATVWAVVKDSLASTRAAGGYQIVLDDGTNEIGFYVGGYDFLPMSLPFFFWGMKFDVSEDGAFDTASWTNAYSGSYASFNEASVTGIGYGTIHAAKAKSENVYADGFYFIANGSYAMTIDAGTSGTPDTWALVVADDEASGFGIISNLQGKKFDICASWEWGVSANQDSYFDDADFQVFIDANDIGTGNFIVGATAGTGTNSLKLSNGTFINLGTASVWDLSDTDYNTLELDNIQWSEVGTFSAPSSGGTSRFSTNCTWASSGAVTSNGADMSGSSILTPAILANTSGLIWNMSLDPDGLLDDMTFTKTSGTAHHAIEFGTTIPDAASYTLRGCAFGTDFSATEDGSTGDETFHFKDTTGTITLNLVGCTGNAGYRTEGVAVTIVNDPVTATITVTDTADPPVAIGSVRVFLETSNGTGPLPFEDSVSIVQTSGTATVTHTAHGLVTGNYVVIRDATQNGYNKVASITVTTANAYTYAVDSGTVSPATGSPIASAVIISGLTNGSGVIADTRTYSSNQPFKGWARKSSGSPYYQNGSISGTISSTDGFTASIALLSDE